MPDNLDAHLSIFAQRVLLRHPVEADRAEFVELRQSSRTHLEPWEPIPHQALIHLGGALLHPAG